MTKKRPLIEPLIQFDRQCEAAIELYKQAFKAEVEVLMRFGDNKSEEWKLANPEKHNYIYHARIKIGENRVLLCDNFFHDLPSGHTTYLVVQFETAEEVDQAYNVLSDGATIINPLGSATFSARTVELVDKFGVFWGLMVG